MKLNEIDEDDVAERQEAVDLAMKRLETLVANVRRKPDSAAKARELMMLELDIKHVLGESWSKDLLDSYNRRFGIKKSEQKPS